MNDENLEVLRGVGQSVIWTNSPTEVAEGIFVTGEIPRRNNFEDTGGHFFLDNTCTRPDPLVDDQAIFFDTLEGLVAVFGCAHAGVVNTLDYIQELRPGRPFRAVLGGLHLLNARPERVSKTLEALRRRNIAQIVPGHCTGQAAVAQLWTAFPGHCSSCATGTKMILG